MQYYKVPVSLFQSHVPVSPHLFERSGPSRGVLRTAGAVTSGAAALALGGRRVGGGRRRGAPVATSPHAAPGFSRARTSLDG